MLIPTPLLSNGIPSSVRDIYFDMDGVLADMSLLLSKLEGISVEKVQEDRTLQHDLYVKWRAALGDYGFFSQLKPLHFDQNSAVMWSLHRRGFRVSILTSLGWKGSVVDRTIGVQKAKLEFLQEFYGDFPFHRIEMVSRSHRKRLYAIPSSEGPSSILVDDFDRNIREWEAAGGIGLWYDETDPEGSLSPLME